MLKKNTSIVIKVIVFILFINLGILISRFSEDVFLKPHPVARSLFVFVESIDHLLVFPLVGITNGENSVTKPLISINNRLFDAAENKMGTDACEREYWWARIKSQEYDFIYANRIHRGQKNVDVQLYEKWTEQLYTHLLALTDLEISRSDESVNWLQSYIDMAELYERTRPFVVCAKHSELETCTVAHESHNPFIRNQREIERLQTLLDKYVFFKKKLYENHIDVYTRFYSGPHWDHELIFINDATKYAMANRFLRNHLYCDDTYWAIYRQNKIDASFIQKSSSFSEERKIQILILLGGVTFPKTFDFLKENCSPTQL